MNEIQQQVYSEMLARFERNLAAMRRFAEQLYNTVKGVTTSTYSVDIGPNGEISILKNKSPIYLGDARTFARNQVESFDQHPNAFRTEYPFVQEEPKGMVSQRTQHMATCQYKIQTAMGIDQRGLPYLFDHQNILYMQVFGVGAGYHIEELIKRYNIRYMAIHAQELELFYCSLFTADWDAIVDYFDPSKGRRLSITFGELDEQAAMSFILGPTKNPALLSCIYQFAHFKGDYFKTVNAYVRSALTLVYSGWGFYDDEMDSLRYTIGNLKRHIPPLAAKGNLPKKTYAFIVGAGPSLDASIEAIKKHRDRAIVFSCGTALRALHHEGITPDFHLEIERVVETHQAISSIGDPEYLDKIHMIGINVVPSITFDLFSKRSMIFRLNDLGSKMFAKSCAIITHVNPTVGNAGTSIALALGFDTLYLFGLDMGFKDASRHHSKNTIYYDEKAGLKMFKDPNPPTEFEGNFGGTVYSDSIFVWMRDIIIRLFADHPELTAYNCSDGVKLPFTTPLHPDELAAMQLPAQKKSRIIEKIRSRFSNSCVHKNVDQALHGLIDDLQNIADSADRIVAEFERTPDGLYTALDRMQQLSIRDFEQRRPVDVLLGGTLNHLTQMTYTLYLTQLSEPEAAMEKAYTALGLIRDFVNHAVEEVSGMLEA